MDALQARFEARNDNLAAMLQFVESCGKRLALSEALGSKLMLIVEELFTNTNRYGGQEAGRQPVQLALCRHGAELELCYEDAGMAYDPFENLQTKSAEIPVEDRPIGRLGLILVARLSSRVVYEREAGINRTRLWLSCES